MRNKLRPLTHRLKKFSDIPGIRSYALAAFSVFLLGAIISVLSWHVDRQRVLEERNSILNEQVNSVKDSITNRIELYKQILNGGVGLFRASNQVTREEWRVFAEQSGLIGTQKGVMALAYTEKVSRESLEQFENDVRAEGFQDFNVFPEGDRSEYAVIRYVEPFGGGNLKAFGYDMFSESVRQSVMAEARDTGNITISDKIVLIQDEDTGQPGFLMYAPLYSKGAKLDTVEDRRRAIQGYVYAAFRAKQFFSQTLDPSKFSAYSAVQIFDGEEIDRKSLIYESANFEEYESSHMTPPFTVQVQNNTWTFRFAGPVNRTSSGDTSGSNYILVGGVLLSLAVSAFLFLLMLTRARAIVYTKQREAQKSKDDLLSLASHQLRTPATAVKQYLGMMLEGYTGKVNPKQLPAIQKAYNSNERQLEIINQILYVAKADAGRLSIYKRKFDLNSLIDDIISDLSDYISESQQIINFIRTRKKLSVVADESGMRMVIENLITNASKYSYPDTAIEIKTGVKNKEIFVSVKDRGVGIPFEERENLFKKFSRIENELSLEAGGSGVGLYIDKILVDLHGGRIEVESEINEGSTFTVFLPQNGDQEDVRAQDKGG